MPLESTSDNAPEKELSPKKKAKKEVKEKIKEEVKELWEEVGWHRPLGGVMYNYILLLVVILPGLLVISVILPNFILPYPEAVGFYNVTLAYLEFIFFFADFGIKNAVSRYIAEHAETNPRHALKYLSFFIWFQMFTGLVQISLISVYAILIVPNTEMSYAVWFFLIYLMIQWPGSVGLATGGGGIFEVALNGFQQFDKSNILFILREILFTVFTAIIFIFIGRWVGLQNPAIGELMGATMGFIFGMWIDNIIGMGVGMVFFKKTLEPFGLTLRDTFRVTYDKKIIKEVLIFGGKVMPSGLSFYLVSFLITLMLTSWLYNYSTLIGLYFIASTLTSALALSFSNGPPISEAYNNGKKELTLYYIRSQLQWWGLIALGFFLVPVTILFPFILVQIGGEYAEAAWMIYPLFCASILEVPLVFFPGSICENCNIPEHSTYMNFIEQGVRFFTYFLIFNPWFGVSIVFGREYLLIFWLFGNIPAYLCKGTYAWFIIKKKLFPGQKLQIPFLQTLLFPLISMLPFLPIAFLMVGIFNGVFIVNSTLAFVLAAIFLVASLYIVPALIIFPMYGFLGGWDDKSIDDFKKAAVLSGPSRKIVSMFYRKTKFGYDHSPWKGKFVMPHELANKEAEELTLIRKNIEQKAKM